MNEYAQNMHEITHPQVLYIVFYDLSTIKLKIFSGFFKGALYERVQ